MTIKKILATKDKISGLSAEKLIRDKSHQKREANQGVQGLKLS